MLNNLFTNILLIISFILVWGYISRDIPENLKGNVISKGLLGVVGGILGILMMIYNMEFGGTNKYFDLSSLAIFLISSIAGFSSTFITGLILSIYISGYYGINQASILALVHIGLYITIFSMINKKVKIPLKNWFMKLALVVLVTTNLYLLNDVKGDRLILLKFYLVIISVSVLEYYLLKYVNYSNDLFKMYKRDSTKDFLTGLNNARQFDRILNISYKKTVEYNKKLSCLMLDIDHFKRVNDTYGHAVGDLVLKELANVLRKNCRYFDYIGRVGGEEFCILILNCSSEHAFDIANRIRCSVNKYKFSIGKDKYINITVSIGIATYPDTVTNVGEIVEKADVSLYKAKQTGRDKVCEYQQCVNYE